MKRENPLDTISDVIFTVVSLVQKTMPQGSYERAIGLAVAQAIRADIEDAISEIRAKGYPQATT